MNSNMRKMYTEQQIGDIAKAVVQSGTKLYKHTILATETNNIEGNCDIIVISTDSSPYTLVTNDILNNAISTPKVYSGGVFFGYFITSATCISINYDNEEIVVFLDMGYSLQQDTVTPL